LEVDEDWEEDWDDDWGDPEIEGEAATGVVEHAYTPWGAQRALWYCRSEQVLLEGPAGTGKTRALLEYIHWLCEAFPKIRVLWCRQTRESLTESVLELYEDEVLPPGHPAISGTAGRNNRQFYEYPNESRVVLVGLDKPGKTYSSRYDVVCVFEAWETSQDSWERLGRAMRNNKLPWQQRIADTNPASEFHWLNQLFPQGYRDLPEDHIGRQVPEPTTDDYKPTLVRLLSRHQDNPVYFDHELDDWTPAGRRYVMGVLSKMTGARKANLFEGRWASAEGMIFEEYDPAVHIVDPEDAPPMKWYFGAFDKGLRHPGCLQVWGVDHDDRMWRVLEVYQTGQLQDWWAERVWEAHQEYRLEALVCDPAEPEYISIFNDRLQHAYGRDGERIARKARNTILTGIDMVRWGFSEVDDGPRIFILRDSLMAKDRVRVEQKKPTCLEEELPSYVWAMSNEGQRIRERPDPTCPDHAVDCLRYASMFLWRRDMSRGEEPSTYNPGTFGEIMGHDDVEYDETDW